MKLKKGFKDAEALGVSIKKDKKLDKLSGKVLFPKKQKQANNIISKIDWPS